MIIDKKEVTLEWENGKNYFGTLDKVHEKYNYLKKGAKTGFFESPVEFFNALKSQMPTPGYEGSSDSYSGDFNTFKNYKEAWDKFANEPGSLDSKNRLNEMLQAKEETGQTIEYGVTGDFLDVGLYLEGDPECWSSLTYGHPRRFRIDLQIDLMTVCYVNEKDMNHRLQRIIRLVDWAAKNGVAMRIVAVSSNQCGHAEIVIKEYDERLNMNNLIVTAHSEFFRRMFFRFVEYSKTITYGYGQPYLYSAINKDSSSSSVETLRINVYNGGNSMNAKTIDKEFDELEEQIQEHVKHAQSVFVERHVLVD